MDKQRQIIKGKSKEISELIQIFSDNLGRSRKIKYNNLEEYALIRIEESLKNLKNIKRNADNINKKLANIQISISNKQADLIEPNAHSPYKRMQACEILSNEGFRVIGRIAPIIPLWPDGDCCQFAARCNNDPTKEHS